MENNTLLDNVIKISNLSNNETLITLLDYNVHVSLYLKSIKCEEVKDGKILVDTVLCSGNNEYHFISFTVNKSGTLNLKSIRYVNVLDKTLNEANSVLKSYPVYVKNSVLPQVEIDKILK